MMEDLRATRKSVAEGMTLVGAGGMDTDVEAYAKLLRGEVQTGERTGGGS